VLMKLGVVGHSKVGGRELSVAGTTVSQVLTHPNPRAASN
jgi:hypothetical protein